MRRLLLIAALAACAPTVTTSPSPNASASPNASTATATVTPGAPATASVAPSPTAADPSRYGYIIVSPGRIVVRGERATDTSIAIGGERPAASHDGKRIAFWRTGPQGNNPQELRVVEVASGSERVLTSIPAGHAGGTIVWSNDDTGLLYEVHSTTSFPGIGGGPLFSTLSSWDLSVTQAPGETTSGLRLTNGAVFVPLAWDRTGQLSTALTTGEGGFAIDYVTWDRKVQPAGADPVKMTRFPWQVIASTVQADMSATELFAPDATGNELHVWPTRDINEAIALGPAPGAGTRVRDASWRPMVRGDFVMVLDQTVRLYTMHTDRVPTELYRGQGQGTQVFVAGWRVDGSGLLLSEPGRGVFVIDLATRQVTPLPHLGAPVGGVLLR
jgi:hypothetical protein